MNIGFYAGSFDPFTNGHLHVVKKSSELFDQVIVGIGVNSQKSRRFDEKQMLDAITTVFHREGLKNVSAILYTGLTADVALESGATYLIRGIRNGMDYQYEENIAAINEEVDGIDTIYIRAGSLGNVSSSMVMELLKYGKDVSSYLPPEVLTLIKK